MTGELLAVLPLSIQHLASSSTTDQFWKAIIHQQPKAGSYPYSQRETSIFSGLNTKVTGDRISSLFPAPITTSFSRDWLACTPDARLLKEILNFTTGNYEGHFVTLGIDKPDSPEAWRLLAHVLYSSYPARD